jgi:hypothetical protein
MATELELAYRQTEASVRRSRVDLAEQQRKLQESEGVVALLRHLRERNHVADDISRLIKRGQPKRKEAT